MAHTTFSFTIVTLLALGLAQSPPTGVFAVGDCEVPVPPPQCSQPATMSAMEVKQRRHARQPQDEATAREPHHDLAETSQDPHDRNSTPSLPGGDMGDKTDRYWKAGATAAVLACSGVSFLCSCVLSIYPNLVQHHLHHLLAYGAGAMLADFFLHIIPHAFSHASFSHSHHHEHISDSQPPQHHSTDKSQPHTALSGETLCVSVLMGVLLAYMIDNVLTVVRSKIESALYEGQVELNNCGRQIDGPQKGWSGLDRTESLTTTSSTIGSLFGLPSSSPLTCGFSSSEHSSPSPSSPSSPPSPSPRTIDKTTTIRARVFPHQPDPLSTTTTATRRSDLVDSEEPRGPITESGLFMKRLLTVRPVAAMSLLCDLVHNFMDAIVVCTTFRMSWRLGVVSSVAILAHEVAQELSDFATLVHSGLTRKEALLANVGVSFSSLIGLIFVICSGCEDWPPSVTAPVLCGAGGTLLYMSLAELLPQSVADRPPKTITDALVMGLCVVAGFASLHLVGYLE